MSIVIIGATLDIGKTLFAKYANENNRIGIIGRRAHLVDELYQKYSSKAIPAKADITNLEEIGQAICTLHETLGRIDLAIACAGTRKKKSKAYITKRWHILAIINKILPYCLYKRM